MRGILRSAVTATYVMLASVVPSGGAMAQDDFRKWMQQQQSGATQQLREFQEYKDARDRTPGKRDPNFQYWGKAVTAADGTFSFRTIVPGAYAPRPAHIHFKVWVDGQVRLTSQIYFANYPSQSDSTRFSRNPGLALQTVRLESTKDNEFNAYFQIII